MIRIGRFFEIEVSWHWTLLLLILWTAFSAPMGTFLSSAMFTVAIFACVLLHEFGHALAARQFGIATPSICLYPIGGVATLERMPRNPMQELWIAVAGPLVNVAIASALFVLLAPASWIFGTQVAGWMSYLMLANMGLVVFNLLPAFPMDGGRVLRSISAMFTSYADATRLAATVGKYMAIGFAVLGVLYGHLMLILIAGFIYLAGSAEANAVANEFLHRPSSATAKQPWVRATRNGRVVTVAWDSEHGAYRIVSNPCGA